MATAYKTPGVYVEEIVKFPPSVAEVETAIPAFIGYTEIALKKGEDLTLKPTKVRDIKQFEAWFGFGATLKVENVALDANNIPIPEDCEVTNSNYYLYDSIRLFYDNGGGVCYIVSVGSYPDPIKVGDDSSGLKGGLNELRKFDEPTLILFPDAINISDDAQLGGLQQAALLQCADLGDRFSIFDVKDTDDLDNDIEIFRTNVGMNNLKYGAGYYPWVNTIYEREFRLIEIMNNLQKEGADKQIESFFTDPLVLAKITNFKSINADMAALSSGLADFYNSLTGTGTPFTSLGQFYNSKKTDNTEAALADTFHNLYAALLQIDGLVNEYTSVTEVKTQNLSNSDLKTTLTNYTKHSIQPTLQKLLNLDAEAYGIASPPAPPLGSPPAPGEINTGGTEFDNFFAANAVSTTIYDLDITAVNTDSIRGTTALERINSAFGSLDSIVKEISNHFLTLNITAENNSRALELALINDISWYPAVVKALNSKVTQIPPSGGVAGIYASVDNDRGVWKAPANVSMNSVSSLTEFIDDKIQENLNVDTNAGKSVNALRYFTGKGIIVWGARTLAGNDNEWRYVPVRRFFNFVEESCKKSTAWAVFEPNDANTWVRIKAQIENFLNNLWRRGALQGAKPEHAYFVNCGLGITMNAQDILEGRLIVEIGMAVVRPAEFIILKFSHKLPQS